MKIQGIGLGCFIFFSCMVNNAFAKQTVVNIAYNEYKPYMSHSLVNEGILNHIVKESFAIEGVDVNLKAMSPTKIFRLIKSGKLDASVGWTSTEDRKRFSDFSSPIYTSDMVLFYRKNNLVNWKDVTQTNSPIFGVTKAYFYGDEFESAIKTNKIKIQSADSDEINFKKLIRKRIDAFPVALDVGRNILNKQFSKEQRQGIMYSQDSLYSDPLALMFSTQSENHKHLMETFERGLAALKKRGDYQKIIQKFNTRLNKAR